MNQSKPLEDRYDGCGLIARQRAADKKLDPADRPKLPDDYRLLPIERLAAIGAAAARAIDQRRQQFQKSCNRLAKAQLGVVVFDDMDAYELESLPWMDVSPDWFLRERFGKDFARLKVEHANRLSAEKEAEDGR